MTHLVVQEEWLCIGGYSRVGTSNHFVDINEMVVNIESMGNIKEIKRTLTLLRKITKYGVFLLSSMCTIYCGLMYLDLDFFGIHLLLFGFALVLRLTLSKAFGLCWVHRLAIIYIFLVSLCIATLRHNIVLIAGLDIKTIQRVMFDIGLCLIPLILWKAKDKSCIDNIYDDDNNKT